MVSIKEKVHAEMENIAVVLAELEKVKDRSQKELVVLVGMGAYLQNIYTGMENILKQLLLHKSSPIPDTPTWHKDLLNSAVEHNIITNETADKIGTYLFFRHFFTHAYGFLCEFFDGAFVEYDMGNSGFEDALMDIFFEMCETKE